MRIIPLQNNILLKEKKKESFIALLESKDRAIIGEDAEGNIWIFDKFDALEVDMEDEKYYLIPRDKIQAKCEL